MISLSLVLHRISKTNHTFGQQLKQGQQNAAKHSSGVFVGSEWKKRKTHLCSLTQELRQTIKIESGKKKAWWQYDRIAHLETVRPLYEDNDWYSCLNLL